MEDNKEVIEDIEETVETENNEDVNSTTESETDQSSDDIVEENNDKENDLDNMRKLKDENKKLNNEVEALKERLLRISAEYDNYRKRTTKEKEGIYTEACTDVLKEMIPVLDTLERAIAVDGSVEDLQKRNRYDYKRF